MEYQIGDRFKNTLYENFIIEIIGDGDSTYYPCVIIRNDTLFSGYNVGYKARYKAVFGKDFYYIYEYSGDGINLVIVESNSIAFPVGDESGWLHGRDEYLGNFTKSNNFRIIYDILNS